MLRLKNGLLGCFLGLAACTGGGGASPPQTPPVLAAPAWLNTGVRVMALGDSITEGWKSSYGGYRFELYRRFIEQNIPVNFVGSLTNTSEGLPDPNHEGHGGWTSYHLRDGRADNPEAGHIASWLAADKPQVILLLVGTNDVFYTADDAVISSNILSLIDRIRALDADVEIFVGSTPPLQDFALNQRINRFNQTVLQGLTLRMGSDAKLHFVDIYRALEIADLDADGVHVRGNGAGNAKLAAAWFAAIEPTLRRLAIKP